ncbi:hypothetical protein GCM10009654_14450 [Streptomyces hebeiensis]|uniref:Uncharacterized protein n=1 Tax=Streptomyces hebeiensis TaxID=229486 RepID=A0ABN1UMU5_9ACTN
MPEPLERPEKIVSPMRPVEPPGEDLAGGAGGVSIGVVEAMVFPVCVGERGLPWRRCTGWGGRPPARRSVRAGGVTRGP